MHKMNAKEREARHILKTIAKDMSRRFNKKFFVKRWNDDDILFGYDEHDDDCTYIWLIANNKKPTYQKLLDHMIKNPIGHYESENNEILYVDFHKLYGRTIDEIRVNLDLLI